MADSVSHSVWVRDKAIFLRRLMVELAGDARISFEGDLSEYQFPIDLGESGEETEILKRNTIAPRSDFAVLPLTRETVFPILSQVVRGARPLTISGKIIHVQIEREGVLELGAYDNFHRECVVTGPGVSAAILEQMKTEKMLRDFKAVAKR